MTFRRAEPDGNLSILRLSSENGTWDVGFFPVIFGVRVGINRRGSEGFWVKEYCAGADQVFQGQLLLCLVAILECLPENTTERELQNLLPGYRVKPINLDPCWPALQQLRDRLQRHVQNPATHPA